jgi:DNA modification methylase
MERNIIHLGDCLDVLKTLPDNSIDCCVTSPPYYALRDYGAATWEGGDPNCPHYRTSKAPDKTATGHKRMQDAGSPVGDAIYKDICPLCGAVRVDKQLGLENTPEEYIAKMTEVFMEVHRVLKPEGTLWLNIGDSYWGGGWRNAQFNEHRGDLQKGSKGTYCGESMPACKGNQGVYKPKDLIGIPWMLAFSLRSAGWYLRQDIIWAKNNPMPESVTDRCTKSHEYIFLLSKSQKYYFDHEAIQEPAVSSDDLKRRIKNGVEEWNTDKAKDTYAVSGTGRSRTELYSKKKMPKFGGNKYGENEDTHFSTYSGNEWQPQTQGEGEEEVYVRNKRDVWQVNVKPCKEAHFATYPPDLVIPCILAGCPVGGVVLDPFMGSGTTALVAKGIGRDYIGIELNPEYKAIAERRLFDKFGLFL